MDNDNGVTWKEYIERRFCDLEKLIDANNRASKDADNKRDAVLEARLHNLNEWKALTQNERATFFTSKEHDLYKDVTNIRFQNLEQSKSFLEGRASQTSVLIFGAISVIGFLITIIGFFSK